MFLFSLILTTMSIGLVLSTPHNLPAKREIQNDGGYPKFPPEDYEQSRVVRNEGLSKVGSLESARFHTKEIPIDFRSKRGVSDLNVKDAFDFMKEMYSAYQEVQGTMGTSEASGSEDTAEDETRADTQFDPSQMSPELQQFWEQAVQLYQKFQAEQAAQEEAGAAASE
ncbi:hypothetical protein WDU94_013405 [Cyamophila willieti]